MARSRRRRRARTTAVAALALAVTGGTIVTITQFGGRHEWPPAVPVSPQPAITPAPTVSASRPARRASAPPSVSASAPPSGATAPAKPATSRTTSGPSAIDVRKVDWNNATIRLAAPAGDDDCLTGKLRFHAGKAGGPDGAHVKIGTSYTGGPATFGDLTDDGRPEAILYGGCFVEEDSGDSSGQVLVVDGSSGTLTGTWIGPVAQVIDDVEIANRLLTVTVTVKYSDPEVTQKRVYRWTGTRYTQVSGPTSP